MVYFNKMVQTKELKDKSKVKCPRFHCLSWKKRNKLLHRFGYKKDTWFFTGF